MRRPMTPLLALHRARQLYADKTAVACGEHVATYREFGSRVDRLAWALDQQLAVQAGDRVAVLSPNCHRLLEAYFAVPVIGGVLLPLNVRLRVDELAFILVDAGVEVLLVHPDFAELTRDLVGQAPNLSHIVWLDTRPVRVGDLAYEDLLRRPSELSPLRFAGSEDDVAEIFYTSGTTGRPKGVMLTHRNLYSLAVQTITALALGDEEVFLHSLPLYHANGWGAPHALTFVGGTHVVVPYPRPALVAEAVAEWRVTLAYMVPTMLIQLLAAGVPRHALRSLSRIVVGGAAPAPALGRQVADAWGSRVIGAYGLTEHSPVATFAEVPHHWRLTPEQRHRVEVAAGVPMIGVETRLVAEDGHDVPQDGRSIGELWLRSDTVMKGYWRRPEETAEVLTADGWLRTGDLATISPQGLVTIVDRAKDIVISGGENISSVEIEAVLADHPAVLECAVVAAPDAVWGERPHAFVVLRPRAVCTPETLQGWCRDRLAHFKAPDVVHVVADLPKTGTGKIQKAALRECLRHSPS